MNNFEAFLEKSKLANVIPLVETIAADLLTPLSVYLKLSADTENSFLLESVEGGESLARYSFIGVEPHSIVNGNNREIIITDKNGSKTEQVPMFEFLRRHFATNTVLKESDLPSFSGGAIGFFGFSCAGWFEPTVESAPRTDDATFMFFRSLIAFDHAKQVTKIISLIFIDEAEGDETKLRILYRKAMDDNARIKQILESPWFSLPPKRTQEKNVVVSNWTKSEFEAAVVEIKELIAAGECYQVVLSQRFTKKTQASAISIYRAMRSLNPSPYMFLISLGGKAFIGASPEMLVKCHDGELEYRPIAGTRKRGLTVEEDDILAAEMLADKKEVAEHLMLVDLGRNDLGRVAKFGSIEVRDMLSVEKYSHVQHLVSYLFARVSDDCDRFDALASCFPAGTVSGAPKVRAMEIIKRLEPTPRGIYSGAVGYFDYSGNLDTCIAIRTIVLENGVATVQAGAGIVADSVPKSEYQETVNKASALIKAIEIAEESDS